VIPYCGPSSGLTRVVILGNNFVESPTTRVKFDNIEVIPYFHGSKTLICHVPQHKSGTISVTVCNTTNAWSSTSARFTYVDVPEGDQKVSNPFFNIANIKIEGEDTDIFKPKSNPEISTSFDVDDLDSAFFGTPSYELEQFNLFDQVEVISGFY